MPGIKAGQIAVGPRRPGPVEVKLTRALGKIGDTPAVEPLIAVPGDEDADARRAAAEALGEIGDKQADEVPFPEVLPDEPAVLAIM